MPEKERRPAQLVKRPETQRPCRALEWAISLACPVPSCIELNFIVCIKRTSGLISEELGHNGGQVIAKHPERQMSQKFDCVKV
jgi:hypothetical protein